MTQRKLFYIKPVMPKLSPEEKALIVAGVPVADLARQPGELFESAAHKESAKKAEEENNRSLFKT